MKFVWRVVFDVVLIYSISRFGTYIDESWEPAQHGYTCADYDALSHEFKENTVTPRDVVVFSIIVPIILMVCTDLCFYGSSTKTAYKNVTSFMLGGALTFVTCNIIKFKLGVLRPYFLTLCKPNTFRCSSSATDSNSLRYLSALEFVCTDERIREIRQARLSFPSLHAAMTSFATVYIMAHLNQRIQKCYGHVYMTCKVILQVASVTWLMFVVTSRVTDYRHHVSDVIAGTMWGATFAAMVITQTSGMSFRPLCVTWSTGHKME